MIHIIVNPIAGNGKTKAVAKEIFEYLDSAGISYTTSETTTPLSAAQLVKAAIKAGCTKVFCIGGDGTISQTASALVGSEIPLGIIPCGTGNDFVKMLNLSKKPIEAFKQALKSDSSLVDICTINDHNFINVAGTGFDVDVLRNTMRFKKRLGSLAYVVGIFASIAKYKPHKYTIEIDGKRYERELLLVAIANGKYFGGGMCISPKSMANDGFLDIVMISDMPKWRIIMLLPTLLMGTHIKLPVVQYLRCKQVKISTGDRMTFNVDGEIEDANTITISIVPNGLKLLSSHI